MDNTKTQSWKYKKLNWKIQKVAENTKSQSGKVENTKWKWIHRGKVDNTKKKSGKYKNGKWKIQKVKVENAKLEILKVGAHAAESEWHVLPRGWATKLCSSNLHLLFYFVFWITVHLFLWNTIFFYGTLSYTLEYPFPYLILVTTATTGGGVLFLSWCTF